MNTKFAIEFNNTVNNVKAIIREARHMDIDSHLYEWLSNNVVNFLDDVNFNMEFADNSEDYVRGHMLDLMDALKDTRDDEHCKEYSNDYKIVNSAYDCVKEFYFDAPYACGFLS